MFVLQDKTAIEQTTRNNEIFLWNIYDKFLDSEDNKNGLVYTGILPPFRCNTYAIDCYFGEIGHWKVKISRFEEPTFTFKTAT